jgi:hypothetical protein
MDDLAMDLVRLRSRHAVIVAADRNEAVVAHAAFELQHGVAGNACNSGCSASARISAVCCPYWT